MRKIDVLRRERKNKGTGAVSIGIVAREYSDPLTLSS